MKEKVISVFKSLWMDKGKDYLKDPQKVKALAEQATSFMSKGKLKEVASNLGSLIDYVRDSASGKYQGYSIGNLTIAVAALIYVVSPIDFIPDLIPALGFVDDAMIVIWAVKRLYGELQAYRRWKG